MEGIPRDPSAQRAQAVTNARRAVASGVTTIQDLGDSGYAVVNVRESVQGDLSLPRLRASGPPITTPGGHCYFLTGAETEPGEVAAAVRRRAERGVDVIKVMASGGNITPGSLPWESQLDENTLRVLVDESPHRGAPRGGTRPRSGCAADVRRGGCRCLSSTAPS